MVWRQENLSRATSKERWKEIHRRLRVNRLRYRFASFSGSTVFVPSTEVALRLVRDLNKKPVQIKA